MKTAARGRRALAFRQFGKLILDGELLPLERRYPQRIGHWSRFFLGQRLFELRVLVLKAMNSVAEGSTFASFAGNAQI